MFSAISKEVDECTALESPQEIFATTCKDCIDKKLGWCNGSKLEQTRSCCRLANVFGMPFLVCCGHGASINFCITRLLCACCAPEARRPGDLSFGMCLRDSLSFLCNSDFPKTFRIQLDMQYGKTMDACAGKYPAPPIPKTECEENFSCQTCTAGDGCTWCGPIPGIDDIKMNVLGQCRTDGDCKKFQLGTLGELLKGNYYYIVSVCCCYSTAQRGSHVKHLECCLFSYVFRRGN